MHDPMSVAFEIYLLPKKKKNGQYRSPLITIWHVDPENDGSDDSCDWFGKRLSEDDRVYVKKIAKDQFYQIYARKHAIQLGKDYASVCYNQDIYGAIYWLWRVFSKGKETWQYGRHLSNKEVQYVYQLATNPVDNFQNYKNNTLKEFEDFVSLVYRAYKRYHRPWYKHPRWHIHHWRIQFPPIQKIKRRYWDKCSVCGKRGFKGAAHSDWGGTEIWHSECDKPASKP